MTSVGVGIGMGEAIELPSMEEILEIENKQSRAREALEISSDGLFVKCQCCGSLKAMATKPVITTEPKRIHKLRMTIERIEQYRSIGFDGVSAVDTRRYKEELAALLEQERKSEIFHKLPLLSSPITEHRYFCSDCYNKTYSLSRVERVKKERKKENK